MLVLAHACMSVSDCLYVLVCIHPLCCALHMPVSLYKNWKWKATGSLVKWLSDPVETGGETALADSRWLSLVDFWFTFIQKSLACTMYFLWHKIQVGLLSSSSSSHFFELYRNHPTFFIGLLSLPWAYIWT